MKHVVVILSLVTAGVVPLSSAYGQGPSDPKPPLIDPANGISVDDAVARTVPTSVKAPSSDRNSLTKALRPW